jgi:tetratricopeptide (TPR) repeat protein
VLTEQGLLGEARVELERSRLTREKLLGEEHPVLTKTWNELGALAEGMGDAPEAIRCHERELLLVRAWHGNDSVSFTRSALNLAVVLPTDDRPDDALPLLEASREVIDRHPDMPARYQLQWERVKGVVETGLGHLEEAERHTREAIAIGERTYGPNHPTTAQPVLDLARELDARGRAAEALVAYDRFVSAEEGLGATQDPEYAMALGEGGRVLKKLDRGPAAVERLERAVGLLPLDKGNLRRAATVRFMLAEVLVTDPQARQRAKTLALAARDAYDTAHRPTDAKRVDQWLEAHQLLR